MKRIVRLITIALVVALAQSATAQIPVGYYRSLNGKSGAELKSAIREITYNHTELSYSNLPKQAFRYTDTYPDKTNSEGAKRWWDMYSDIPLYCTVYASGSVDFSGLNREHSFPKSWWGGGSDTPAYTDINHLYPAEAAANMKKSNWPLGVVYNSASTYNNGVVKVGSPVTGSGGGASTVFEPSDEYKGDFARTYFYMVTTYSNLTWANNYRWMLEQNAYPTLKPWAYQMLLQWAAKDPVSEKEINRNEQVYRIQGNRNPFIDYPQLAEYIWGDKKDTPFSTEGEPNPGDPLLITPTQGMALEFGEVAIGSEATAMLNFRGENLTGNIEIVISRNDKTMFASSESSFDASSANTLDGHWVKVTYKPTALGDHTSKLFVSGGGISGSRGINLTGSCLPVPTLQTLTATEPTDVTSTSYVANWNVPQGDVIDYYVVTRTRYSNGESSSEELLAEENSLLIDDVTGSESYFVQSVRLGHRSAPSNVVLVEPLGVSQLWAAQPFGTLNIPGGVRFVAPEPVYSVAIYDLAGRVVVQLPEVVDGQEVMLPYGCYVIAAPGQRAPFRMIVH